MNLRSDGQPSIDLADLVTDPLRIASVDPNHLPALLAQLSAVQASVAARLVSTARDAAGDAQEALLTIEQAADRLGVSRDWLYRRTKRLPFVVRVGRHVRFSANGIDRYIRNRMGA
jgi:excisionase family DNA binding protein